MRFEPPRGFADDFAKFFDQSNTVGDERMVPEPHEARLERVRLQDLPGVADAQARVEKTFRGRVLALIADFMQRDEADRSECLPQFLLSKLAMRNAASEHEVATGR